MNLDPIPNRRMGFCFREGGDMRKKHGIIFAVIGIIIFFFCMDGWGAEYNVTLGMDGEVMFVKKGWFKSEFYPISLIRGEWHWKSPDGWKRIATPYESVFDRGGADNCSWRTWSNLFTNKGSHREISVKGY